MTDEQMQRVREIAADRFSSLSRITDCMDAILAALDDPMLGGGQNEYICKCGLRVTPHRCNVSVDF